MAEGAGSKGIQRAKSQALAAWLKAHQIERTSGQCPWDCGHSVPNGGPGLMSHLNNCHGSPKRDIRRK
jgi:hypothetical protein